MDKHPLERGLDEYPTEWREEFQRFSEAMLTLSVRFGSSVRFLIWDPRSFQGLVQAIRFRVHRYPTFVVNRGVKIIGVDVSRLEQALLAAGASIIQEKVITPQL